MTKFNPYEKLMKKVITVEISGVEVPIKPKVRDYGVFMAMGKNIRVEDPIKQVELEEKKTEKLNETLVTIYHRPVKADYKREDIEEFVMQNYVECLKGAFISMGLAKKEDFDKIKEDLPLDVM